MSQRGSIQKAGKVYRIRWRAHGKQRQLTGFKTKQEAQDVLDLELKKLRMGRAFNEPPTLDVLVADFFAQYDKSDSRKTVLRWALAQAQERFGSTPIDRLHAKDLGAWRASLPEARRHQVFAGVRQVLEQAVRWKLIDENPAKAVENPTPRKGEVAFFTGWPELRLVAAEIGEWEALVVFAAGTGLRPEEWVALERRDVDVVERVVSVRRVFAEGEVKQIAKTERSRRRVPLRGVVVDALRSMPARVDTRLVFPGTRGGYLNLHNWRDRDWKPAVEAAGLEPRTPYAMRHSYAAWSISAGVDLFTLSRRMGTSLDMIDKHYGHLLPSGEEHERFVLDSWDAGERVEREAGSGRARGVRRGSETLGGAADV